LRVRGLAFPAVEPPLAEFLFQLLDLLAQEGLGHAALFGSVGEMPRPPRNEVAASPQEIPMVAKGKKVFQQ